MDIGKPVNCIIKTIFKNNKMSRLLTKKIENFPGLYIDIKKIECIVNVRYRERTIKSSLLTNFSQTIAFFKGCNRRKKRKCMQMSTSLQPFCNFSIEYLTTKYSGQLIENRIFIHDILESRDLFSGGYYGKPLRCIKTKKL